MPKKRTSPLTPQEIELHDFMPRTKDPFPQNPARLRALAGALLIRISAKDKDLGKVLRGTIRGWTGLEHQRTASPDGDWIDNIDEKIERLIAGGVTNKLSHMQPTILIQWAWLNEYLSRHSFPIDSRSKANQVTWIANHSRYFIRELRIHPCRCNYPTSFNDWLPKGTVGPCKTINQTTDYLLAYFHNTTRSNLLKLMKPSQQHHITTSSPLTARPSTK